jgi:hypothetical protein
VRAVAQVRERLRVPGPISPQAYELMGRDWRFTSAKAEDELGYRARPLRDTVRATAEWYLELIENGAFEEDSDRSPLAVAARGVQLAHRAGLLWGLVPLQAIVRRRLIAGR